MGLTGWIAAFGVLLLLTSLASGWIRRLPITSFWIFLMAGIAGGPWGWNNVTLDLPDHAHWLSLATEASLVISLFIAGLKLRVPFRDPAWRMALRLAFPAMLLCIAGVCCVVHWALGFSWPLALVCGTVIAPTDPVLASMVSVDDASDQDAMRIALSGEASLNDGAALPFLVLALIMQGTGGTISIQALAHWFTGDLLWSLTAGLAIGGSLGWLLGLLGTRMKSVTNDVAPSDFLALAIVALAFAAAAWLSASTFLAAFAAGLGLRHAELLVVSRHPSDQARQGLADDDQAIHPPAELLINPNRRGRDEVGPAESVGMVVSDALSFGDTLERLVAAALVFATGAALALHWSFQAIGVAAALFIVIRPASVYIATVGSGVPRARRLLMGWLGIRGIGTINYLAYALTHGVGGQDAEMITTIAITTVALSVIVHGASARPLMLWRHRRIEAAKS